MLEDEGALFVRMALKANRILRRRSAKLVRPGRSMWIVTVGALQQSFIHTMVKRHGKLGLLLQVAGITKFRLRLDQQKLPLFRVMGRMARSAGHIILGMQ